jgi:hypothetical protein
MSAIFPGPCQRCGARNYQLSNAGPAYCSPCSSLAAGEQKQVELERWKRWNMAPGIERPTKPFDDKRKHPGLLGDWPTG